MKALYDEGKSVDFGKYSEHSISGVLKLWLRELPEPLFTFECYDMCIATDGIEDESSRLKQMITILNNLPLHHYAVLEYLFRFLQKLASFSKENLMTTNNIAIVFAPNLLKPKVQDLGLIMQEAVYNVYLFIFREL